MSTIQLPPKFSGTIAIDPLGEWARLTFSKDMGKLPTDIEDLKQINNYNGATERICVILRQLKQIRDKFGCNVVVTAHEGIDRIYAKGGAITPKGQTPQDPIAIYGRPDIPGQVAPNEVMRAFDNVLRVRMNGGNLTWVAAKEALGGGGNTWEVKDRFNACAITSPNDKRWGNGYLPPSYAEIEKLALACPATKDTWDPPYMWLIYGPPGYQKTRSLVSFPGTIRLFDLDQGSKVLSKEIKEGKVVVSKYNTESHLEYNRFITDLFEATADPTEVQLIKKALGLSK